MNILVLDDEKPECDLFKERFEQEDGIVCMTALTTDEAISKMKVMRFDVLMADILLQGDNRGDSFAKECKKRNPWLRVFIFSGSDNTRIVQGLEPEAILTKPIDFDEILEILSKKPETRPREIDNVQLSEKDSALLVELANKVVEHTNIVASTQSLITENLEELSTSQERSEQKLEYVFHMLRQLDESGMLKMYNTFSKFMSSFFNKMFWGIIILIGMFILKGPLLTLINQVLHK